MPDTLTPPLRRALVPLLLAAAAAAAWAEKADRALPMVVEADKPGTKAVIMVDRTGP